MKVVHKDVPIQPTRQMQEQFMSMMGRAALSMVPDCPMPPFASIRDNTNRQAQE